MRELIADTIVIAAGIILLIHFALFWVYGGLWVYESNRPLLALETAMAVGIIALGIDRLRNDSRKY